MAATSRFFVELSYLGTHFHGWQIQPKHVSVQSTIEKALSEVYRFPVSIVGCGRTDSGVHAKHYIFHYDVPEEALPPKILLRLNKLVGEDIAISNIYTVPIDLHARYSARSRSYQYHIISHKDPFQKHLTWQYPRWNQLNHEAMQQTATLFTKHNNFFTFCKTRSDVTHYECFVSQAYWDFNNNGGIFHVSANRFLRGMVRLLVGACIGVGENKLSLNFLDECLTNQQRLPQPYSVPAQGLFLDKIVYPDLNK